jgi:hypothetical protein
MTPTYETVEQSLVKHLHDCLTVDANIFFIFLPAPWLSAFLQMLMTLPTDVDDPPSRP